MKDLYDFSAAKRGAVAPGKGKTRITIMLDDAVLEAARQRADNEGMGYQTLINKLLKEALCEPSEGSPSATLSDILTALHNLAAGQEQLQARFEQPPAGNGGTRAPLTRYSREASEQLGVRETPAEMKVAKKRPGKPE